MTSIQQASSRFRVGFPLFLMLASFLCLGSTTRIVEEEGDRFLVLPGVNPSMRFLNLVEPEKVLEACLDYAHRLARWWGLKGVWIPTSPTIHSNRMAIRKAIRDRDFTVRGTADHAFSYSPYAYSIREVFVVPV